MFFELSNELSKYEVPYELIPIEDVKSGKVNIPESWFFLYESPKNEWAKEVIEQWSTFGLFLPKFTACISRCLYSVEIVKIESFVTLIYVFDVEGEPYLYFGGNPKEIDDSESVTMVLDSLPSKLKEFYLDVHDGFGFLADSSMGPLSTHSFFNLSQPNWVNLNKRSDYPFGLNLSDWNVVYVDEGDFLALNKYNSDECVLWRRNSPLEYVDFWSVLDQMMTDGLLE
ncbi:hypothetical protein VINI7043_24957 [Vibrio nigripulchritudo ATCC 27043]|nr:hypothetical protein VINI7043_24957 [Vibrio nigripulchritudo ATCC 27043]